MKRLLQIIIIAAMLCPLGRSQSIPISGQVFNQYGSPVAGAQVYICSAAGSSGLPCTPVASIFYDYNLTMSAPNPYSTDANGNFSVYVGPLAFPNTYVVNIVANPGGTPYTQLYPGPSCPLSGCTFSGNVTAPIFNATSSPYYEINGVQISSAALSDAANLAKLNASNVFTGTTQTAPIWNATTQFNVNGSQIAAANLANGTTGTGLIVLQTSPALITPNIGAATGTSLNLSGASQASVFNAATGFQIGGAAASNHILLGNGTDYVDSATVPASAVTGLFYQTVESNGTNQTQRPAANFSSRFALTDSSSPTRTNVDLVVTGTEAKVVTAAAAGTSTHCANWDANGGVGDAGAPCPTPASHQVVALWNGTSGTMIDDGTGGSGYMSGAISWGTTITGTYYVLCNTAGWPTGPNLGSVINVVTIGIPVSSTTFSYGIDTPTFSSGRGNTIPSVTCIAVQ